MCAADFVALCGGCPIIIGADLNSLPISEVYERLLEDCSGVVGHPEVRRIVFKSCTIVPVPAHLYQGVDTWNVNYDGSVSGGRRDAASCSDEWRLRLQSQLNVDVDDVGCGISSAASEGISVSFSSAYAESNRRDYIAAAPCADAVASAASEPSASFEPDFTNYTESFKGCIDYLLYSNHPNLSLVDVLPVLQRKDMQAAKCVGIPSVDPAEPSDHLPLAATFNLHFDA
jgi:hypothetical protein